MNALSMEPVAGVDYASKAEVLTAWNNNDDFMCIAFMSSPTIGNKQSIEASRNYDRVEIRYGNSQKILPITL